MQVRPQVVDAEQQNVGLVSGECTAGADHQHAESSVDDAGKAEGFHVRIFGRMESRRKDEKGQVAQPFGKSFTAGVDAS
jgi:hypothetical protein